MKAAIKYWIFCALVSFTLHSRRYIFPRCPSSLVFKQPSVCIVTGASGGIGAECARELVSRGGWVIFTARDLVRTVKFVSQLPTRGPNSTIGSEVARLDLGDKRSIEEFANYFHKSYSQLHLLVLNAGYIGNQSTTVDGFERSIGVNHLGHMYLTYLLHDVLLSTPHSRVIVVSSEVHRVPRAIQFDDIMSTKNYKSFYAYSHSKLCNVLFSRELAKRWKGKGVTVNALHPGFWAESDLSREIIFGFAHLKRFAIPVFQHLLNRTTWDGTQTHLYCCLSDECGQSTGYYYENCRRDRESDLAKNDAVAKKLWNVSCDLLGIETDWQ